jgi:hypothetical protein
LLQARRALRSEGLPTALDKAYAIAKGGIDFTGAAGKQIAKRAKLGFQDSLKRMVDGMYRFAELDVLARDTGIRPTQSVESAVNTALGSQVTAARALEEGRGVEAGGIIDPDTQEIVAPSLQRVFEVLGGSPLKNEQGMTYAVALRRVGRYERAEAQARQWDKLADDAARDAEANLLTPEQAAAEQQAIATYREQVEAARKAGQPFPATIPTPTTARPEVGVDEPALAERLRLIGEAEATAALGPRPNPNQVYGNKPDAQAKLEADRAYIAGVGQKPEFVQFAEMLRQYTDGLANYAVKTGLWTPEMAKAFRDSDALYVPFKRLIESTTQKPRGPVRGGVTPGTVTPGVQQFRGSDLMLGNPAEALAEYTVALIQRADAYRVGAATIETVEALGERGAGILTKIDGTDPIAKAAAVDEAERAYRAIGMDESEAETMADVFARLSTKNDVIWRNGPEGREYYLVNDKTLVNALTTLNVQDGDAVRALLAIFGPMKRLATAFLTGNNPAFLLGTNLPRDLQMGTLQTTGIRPGDIAAGMVESIKSIFGRSAEVEALSRAGAGVVSQYGGGDISAAGVARRIAPVTAGQQAMATAGRYVGAPLREIERIGRASEMPMRIAASRVARRQAAAAGLSEADQMALASRKFAEATVDFRRRSGYALDRLAEGSVPFYGAAKKGLAQFIKVSGRNPKRVGAALGLIGLAVVMEDISLGEGQERVEALDRPAYERAKYLRIGDTKIALPQELAAFAAAYRVGLAQLREDDPYVYEQFKQAVMNLTPPILGDVIRGKFVPIPVVGQLEELAANRSAFTGRPIVSEAMQRRMPSERRYETTAPTFDVLAAAARKIPGLEQASPIQAEFLLRGLTGGFTPAVTAVTDIPAQLLAGEAARERVPLPFMRQPLNPLAAVRIQPTRASESEREYYALRDKYQQARGTVNNFTTQYERAQAANDTDALNRLSAREQVLLRDPVYRRARADVDAGKGAPSALTVDSELQNILDVLQADIDRTNADFANGRITSRRARQLIDHYNKERQMRMREAAKLMRQNVPSGRQ